MTDPDPRPMILRHIGPSTSDDAMRRAGDAAYRSVDDAPGCTYFAVVERFDGPTYHRDGETYGELWIANERGAEQLDADGIEWQEVDGYGYTPNPDA